MHQRGYAFNSTSDFEIVREIKEKFCFVSGDIKMDNKMAI
jgi:actin-related protein 2